MTTGDVDCAAGRDVPAPEPASAARPDAERRLTALLLRALDGDKAAYRAFLVDLTRFLRARLRARLRRRDEDVEDLLQEVLIAVHHGLETFRPDVPLTAWISAIVRYKVADHHRARFRWDALHAPLDDDGELFVESDSEAADARRDLQRLLATLPKGQREPIVHTRLWGMSVAETAAATGMSESAVKVGVHRGLKALAATIRGKGDEHR
ncbi:sigma-70 family RNA polymerase sigma factor [Burkholderia plantarii]|uniref:sigma-70 family RNA polymerase sigma factor n=1 Tax=Burkholderia plantarii TaxID=41899 RepID=UPI00272CC8D7|nr:sigma-70 family RNA polymerase sigma factor [Burkholderia plantarii]WLE59435.1 sigma-70 family RNA polymerase sigma factor [Burkholderia plantarii]